MGRVDNEVGRLTALTIEEDEIRHRLRQLSEQIGEERIERRRAGTVREPDNPGLGPQIFLAKQEIQRARSGGLRVPDPELVAKLDALEEERKALQAEQAQLAERLEEIPAERVKLIQANADDAWKQYVKAKSNEIERGLGLGCEIREKIRIYIRNVISRREECEATLGILKRAITAAGGSPSAILSAVCRELPEPEPPTRKFGSEADADVRDWLMLCGLLEAYRTATEQR